MQPGTGTPYTFKVPVDEISLVFHASDAHGAPLTHLSREDVQLFDNDKQQNRIVMFQALQDLPIHAGFLFDASASMREDASFDQAIIQMYVSRLLRKGYDRAFVMQFDTDTFIRQDWTDSVAAIAAGAAAVGERPARIDPLTAIFDSLYTACRDQWTQDRSDSSGNFILLFSDGVDNASHAYLSEAVDMCQRAHIAIYAVTSSRKASFSGGFETLNDLTRQTGGRVFVRPRPKEIRADLELMEAEQRNQYHLVYKPSAFVADKSFHRLRVQCPVAGARVSARTGYYAFPKP